MAESWTDPDAVLRDLRFTHGRGGLHGHTLTLIADRPKFTAAADEDEDEYYSYLGVNPESSADFSNGADVASISEMLSMMRNSTDECPKPLGMCRFENQATLMARESIPITPREQNNVLLPPNRGGRNVAIQSIIENAKTYPTQPVRPLPSMNYKELDDDVDINEMSFPPLPAPSPSATKIVSTSKKGNEKGKKQYDIKQSEWPRPSSSTSSSSSYSSLNFAAAAKAGTQKETKEGRKQDKGPDNIHVPVRLGPKQYVPTARSQKIFEKIVLEDFIHDMLKECVFSVAEKQMDLVDERKQKYEEQAVEAQNNLMLLGYDFPVKICLPQQRHLLTDDCLVCKKLCANPDEAKHIQCINLKDISIQSNNEIDNAVTALTEQSNNETDTASIDKLDEPKLNSSSDDIEIVIDSSSEIDETDKKSTDSTTAQDSPVSYISAKSQDLSSLGSDDMSFEDNDSNIIVSDVEFNVKEFKSEFCIEELNANSLNASSASNAKLYDNAKTNNLKTEFAVVTGSQNDFIDNNSPNNYSSALNSDDYENTDEWNLQIEVCAQKVTNETGAFRQYDKLQNIPKEEITNKVNPSLFNRNDRKEVKEESIFQTKESISARKETNNTGIFRHYVNIENIPKEEFPNIVAQSVKNEVKINAMNFQTIESISAPKPNKTGASRKYEASIPKEENNEVAQSKDEIIKNKSNLPKHTYLRLLNFLKKSVAEEASIRVAENQS